MNINHLCSYYCSKVNHLLMCIADIFMELLIYRNMLKHFALLEQTDQPTDRRTDGLIEKFHFK